MNGEPGWMEQAGAPAAAMPASATMASAANISTGLMREGLLLINWPTFRLTSRWFLA
jgi:hypothetical protein